MAPAAGGHDGALGAVDELLKTLATLLQPEVARAPSSRAAELHRIQRREAQNKFMEIACRRASFPRVVRVRELCITIRMT